MAHYLRLFALCALPVGGRFPARIKISAAARTLNARSLQPASSPIELGRGTELCQRLHERQLGALTMGGCCVAVGGGRLDNIRLALRPSSDSDQSGAETRDSKAALSVCGRGEE